MVPSAEQATGPQPALVRFVVQVNPALVEEMTAPPGATRRELAVNSVFPSAEDASEVIVDMKTTFVGACQDAPEFVER